MPAAQPDTDRLAHRLQRSLINPVVKAAWRVGLGPPGDGLLETTGWRTGRRRLTPICDGQDGSGTAHILDADDPNQRRRIMARDDFWRRICVQASAALSTDVLTIRIDLDPR